MSRGRPSKPSPTLELDHVQPPEQAFEEEPSTVSVVVQRPMAADTGPAYLILLCGRDVGQVYRLEDADSVIGRDRRCTIQLEDMGISRRHLRITRNRHGSYLVEDLGSRNGAFLNHERLTGPRVLTSNDRLGLGARTVLKFVTGNDPEAAYALTMYDAAMNDKLTGLANRRALEECFVRECAFARRHGAPLSVVIFDLDHFKQVNDVHGHLVGDRVLHEFAALIKASNRTEDCLGRYGGEEFAMICRQTDASQARVVAERVRQLTADNVFCPSTHDLHITVSAGVAAFTGESDDQLDYIFSRADAALYRAKRDGRNRVEIAD